jgi:2,4-didehydro-3-deoxy-L-rhamnonate hydrolase
MTTAHMTGNNTVDGPIRLLRVGDVGHEVPVIQDSSGRSYDLSPVTGTGDLDGAFFERGGVELAVQALERAELAEMSIAGLRVGPPVARPDAVICIGQNYSAHAAETGSRPPASPIIFFKHPNTVVGPFDDVLIPRGSSRTDWEVELAVVIGRRCRYLDNVDDAPDHIAGFTISNDVSEREFQIELSGGQWSKGKSCETFNPLGPWLVPAGEVADPQKLSLRSFVNGEARQDSNTADMIFPVNYLIWYLSQFLVLEPGDIINTGTPQGVALSGRFPYLAPGDTMSLEVEGLGQQQQRLVPGAADGR